MYEVMRWISLGLSLFALGFSCYSCWFAYKVNGRLRNHNQELRVRNRELEVLCASYWDEICELRGMAFGEGTN